MGFWGVGPFDNDDAGDLFGEIEEVSPGGRANFIAELLSTADDSLPLEESASVVAAVGVVAHLLDPSSFEDDGYLPPAEAVAGVVVDARLRVGANSAMEILAKPSSNWMTAFDAAGLGDEAKATAEKLIRIVADSRAG